MTPTFVTILVVLCLGNLSLAARSKKPSDERRKRFILARYGQTFFRTPEQQRDYERKFFNLPMEPVAMKAGINPTNYNTFLKYGRRPMCLKNSYRRTHSAPDVPINESPKHHGCCTSQRFFTSPPTAICHSTGNELTLLHFGNFNQYFLSQNCTEDPKCLLNCRCRQEYAVYTAVVVIRNYPLFCSLREIRILGCCKCLNIME